MGERDRLNFIVEVNFVEQTNDAEFNILIRFGNFIFHVGRITKCLQVEALGSRQTSPKSNELHTHGKHGKSFGENFRIRGG